MLLCDTMFSVKCRTPIGRGRGRLTGHQQVELGVVVSGKGGESVMRSVQAADGRIFVSINQNKKFDNDNVINASHTVNTTVPTNVASTVQRSPKFGKSAENSPAINGHLESGSILDHNANIFVGAAKRKQTSVCTMQRRNGNGDVEIALDRKSVGSNLPSSADSGQSSVVMVVAKPGDVPDVNFQRLGRPQEPAAKRELSGLGF